MRDVYEYMTETSEYRLLDEYYFMRQSDNIMSLVDVVTHIPALAFHVRAERIDINYFKMDMEAPEMLKPPPMDHEVVGLLELIHDGPKVKVWIRPNSFIDINK